MKISTKSRYGLRILIEVCINTDNGISSRGREIAKSQSLSEAYLEQIMIPMKTNNYIKTQRGCKGGYTLNCPAEDITMLDIIETFEGKVNFVGCVDDTSCDRFSICASQAVWSDLSKSFREKANEVTLRDIVDKHLEKNKMIDFII